MIARNLINVAVAIEALYNFYGRFGSTPGAPWNPQALDELHFTEEPWDNDIDPAEVHQLAHLGFLVTTRHVDRPDEYVSNAYQHGFSHLALVDLGGFDGLTMLIATKDRLPAGEDATYRAWSVTPSELKAYVRDHVMRDHQVVYITDKGANSENLPSRYGTLDVADGESVTVWLCDKDTGKPLIDLGATGTDGRLQKVAAGVEAPALNHAGYMVD